MKKLTLKPNQLKDLSKLRWEDDEYNSKGVKGFEGWTFDSDRSSGEFDAEKGAMTHYKLTLTDPKGNKYIGYGGYYTAMAGECYNNDVEFTLKEKKVSKTSKVKDEEEYKLYLRLKKKYEK